MHQLLRLDWTAAIRSELGVEPSDMASLGPVLDKLRDEICDIDEKMMAGSIAAPTSKLPLLGAFHTMPSKLLAEYEADRQTSLLAKLLSATKQLMSEVDRIVVLGESTYLTGVQTLMHGCCQPYFNELTRGQRGSRPRLYFAGNSLDNDATQGLLYLLGNHHARKATGVHERWGIVAIDVSSADLQAVLRVFLASLRDNCGGDSQEVERRVLVVTSPASSMCEPLEELGCKSLLPMPQHLGAPYAILSVAGLVPAALLGINIMKLLEGAKAISNHFCHTKAAENVVLQFAAVSHLISKKQQTQRRLVCVWNQALESVGHWYEQLVFASLGSRGATATSTVVGTRDRHLLPRAVQVDRCHSYLVHLVTEKFRCDALHMQHDSSSRPAASVPESVHQQTMVDKMSDRRREILNRLIDLNQSNATISMPCADETSLGQLVQLLMLATVVEGRLSGINPHSH